MKKLRFLSLLFCAIAALSFTSCLDDDDDNDNRLSPQDVATCYNLTRGTYTGKAYFSKDPTTTVTNNNDSATVAWSITSDSTMTLQAIPARIFASGITNADVKNAIANEPNVDIPCRISYFRTSPVQWLINPATVTFNNVQYNGETHKIEIGFYIDTYYSFGSYNLTNSSMQLQIIVAGAYVDGQYNRSLITNAFGVSLIKR